MAYFFTMFVFPVSMEASQNCMWATMQESRHRRTTVLHCCLHLLR